MKDTRQTANSIKTGVAHTDSRGRFRPNVVWVLTVQGCDIGVAQ